MRALTNGGARSHGSAIPCESSQHSIASSRSLCSRRFRFGWVWAQRTACVDVATNCCHCSALRVWLSVQDYAGVELSEKRNVENCCERSVRNGGPLKRWRRFQRFDPLTELSHDRASCDGCLGGLVSFNPPHWQSHDEARLARFRFEFDLSAMPVSHDALADRQAEALARTDALGGEKGLEDVREILFWDAPVRCHDLDDRLVVVASGLDGNFTAPIYRIRRIVEQVYPDLRDFARITAYVNAFVRKILRNASVLELVIQHAKRASDLLVHVDVCGLRALLPCAGTHRVDQARDSPGALFRVIQQRADRQTQRDPSHSVAESIDGSFSRRETSVRTSTPALTSAGAIPQASVTRPSRSQAPSVSSKSLCSIA